MTDEEWQQAAAAFDKAHDSRNLGVEPCELPNSTSEPDRKAWIETWLWFNKANQNLW